MTKDDFNAWKNHPVTEILFASLEEIEEEMVQRLVDFNTSGNMSEDYIRGYVFAVRDVLRTTFEDEIVD